MEGEVTNMEYFAVCNREMVVHQDDAPLTKHDLDVLASAYHAKDRFKEESTGIEAITLPAGTQLPEGYKWITIRHQFTMLDGDGIFRLSRAKALAEWREKTRYCGRCGTRLTDHPTLTARQCPECGNLIFPRIEPCIIVLVHRDDKILLARHVQRNQNIYACIAGFMEAGETAEQAVEREIFEETGIKVKNITYFGSQSWPFPSQLMLGFTAEYASGELKLQEEELSDAGWFSRDNCPASPQPGSIAYRLIHFS